MSEQDEQKIYRYYTTQRPIGPGTIPPPRLYKPLGVINYDERRLVENGTLRAWGEVHYDRPLPAREMEDYELKPAPDNPPAPHRGRSHRKTEKSHER